MTTSTFNGFSIADLDLAVAMSEPALDVLRGGSLLLTGGTGFFGQWLLATLVRANQTCDLGLALHVVTRSPAAFTSTCLELTSQPDITLIEGDIRNFIYDGRRLTHVIHAATDTSLAADRDPMDLIDTIVSGTRHVLNVARAAGARDLLYISSGAVYGAQGAISEVDEAMNIACDPLDRRSAYGQAKRLAETMCAIHGAEYGLKPRIARCFAFVGPGMPLDAHFAIGNFIADALAGRAIEIKGDGTPLRSYLYTADLAAWLLRALVIGKPGAAYNIGSDAALSIREIAEVVAGAMQSAAGVKVYGAPLPDAFRSRYIPSINKARADLNVSVWTSLPDAVRATAAWARNRKAAELVR